MHIVLRAVASPELAIRCVAGRILCAKTMMDQTQLHDATTKHDDATTRCDDNATTTRRRRNDDDHVHATTLNYNVTRRKPLLPGHSREGALYWDATKRLPLFERWIMGNRAGEPVNLPPSSLGI